MLRNLTQIIGGDPVKREIGRYADTVDAINALEPAKRAMNDEQLQAQTALFRARLQDGESLDDLLPEAFAVVREASIRSIGLRHFDVQLIGGIVLHEGRIAEMRTGEGKTLVATLPIYLNSLEGKGVHLVTVNDYLARRDARWMGPVFDFLGLTVGVLQEAARTENGRKAFLYDPERESAQEDVHQLRIVERKLAYAADVTYGTNNEFGFDYLRDNMAQTMDARSQRGHNYAILDEVDNILIDEARTPLIISGPSSEDPALYEQMAQVVRGLRAEDYEINERDRTISLTEMGEDHVEQLLGQALRDPDRPEDITPEQARLMGYLEQALRAEYLFKRNKHYVVQGGRVIIVDEFTGRMMAGRRWSDGLHQAVEAKEGVKVRQENVTYATITLQNFFRMYKKLAGMTGTAMTEAEEFNDIYKVDVTPLPTNLEYIALKPDTDLVEIDYREDGNRFAFYARSDDSEQLPVFWRRKDYPDVVYRTEEAKLRAVTMEILARHALGQPLLVGTTSVELSERLSGRLRAEPLKRLAMILILRDAYLEKQGLTDDGMRVDALLPLYAPIDQASTAVMRPFAQDLGLSLNPVKDENLKRLASLLQINDLHRPNLGAILESGIRHNVLNAKKHDEESRIIAAAGALGGVTIATNMAGRGVDIKLGGEVAEEVLAAVNRVLRRSGTSDPEALNLEEKLRLLQGLDHQALGIYEREIELFKSFIEDEKQVKAAGGLHVIGSERHESRRIDNQLRGRAARQGDPGSSQFFLSLEDELMRLFGGGQVASLMERLNIDDATPIAHSIVNRTIEQAQSRVEGANFDSRKHLLEYDDVLNKQREVFYGQRDRVFTKEAIADDMDSMLEAEVEMHVQLAEADPEGPWKLLAWLEETQPTLTLDAGRPYPSYMLRLLLDDLAGETDPDRIKERLLDLARRSMELQEEHVRRSIDEQLERALERLGDQVKQRLELAEMAIEGLFLEAEENGAAVDAQAMIRAAEAQAGLQIQVDDESLAALRQEPERFQRFVPELIESSMGLRVWAGMIQSAERRVGESLGVDPNLPTPIDWDEAQARLAAALERHWAARISQGLDEISKDLEAAFEKQDRPNEAMLTRVLIQMSYGQRSFFDRRTHQRRAVVVPRLSYAFSAAQLLPDQGREALSEAVLSHLEGAQQALQQSLGEAELGRLGAAGIGTLESPYRAALERELEPEAYAALQQAASLNGLEPELQGAAATQIGRTLLGETYRGLFLAVADRAWVDYLTQMEALRTSIGLEAYGQRDPLVQYKSKAFDMFQQLLADIRSGTVSRMFRVQPARQTSAAAAVQSPPPRPVLAGPAPSASPDQAGSKPAQPSKGKRRRRRR
jgi:preprotein translocase subunit SecA